MFYFLCQNLVHFKYLLYLCTMIRLLADYRFSDRLRYKAHRLVYMPEDEEPLEIRGFLGAAIMAALIVDTDEGDARGVAMDTPAQRDALIARYEQEVRRDNGGLLRTEVEAFCEAHLVLASDQQLLLRICHNDRLLDLAVGLTVEYMQRLVREQVCEHIYDFVPWTTPFAQWLFSAGHAETRRQELLSIDWMDSVKVFELNQKLSNDKQLTTNDPSPTFVFDGLRAEQVLCGYWEWLWGGFQADAKLYPDEKVRLAQYKQMILDNEINYDFLKPEMKHFSAEAHNLFRAWMNNWTEFVQGKIQPVAAMPTRKNPQQELFLDTTLPIPPENDYTAVREYILERCKYDPEFKKYYKIHKTKICDQLTFMFGWAVDYNSLYHSLNRKLKFPPKPHLK